MYPYHNKIKQRIKNKELTHYEYVESYKDILLFDLPIMGLG